MIHYRMEGEGPPLLLLHGAFSSLHTYDAWTKTLKEHFTVIRYDLPGFGLTGPNAEDDYTIQNHISYLNKFLQALDIQDCYIAGSSLGGWIAWEFAVWFPRKVKKLILLDAAGFLDLKSIPFAFKLARTAPFAKRVTRFVVKRNILEGFVDEVYYDRMKVSFDLVTRYYDLFTREGNPEAFVKFVNTKFKDNTRYLKSLRVPTLILWGREDRWIPLATGERFHQAIPENEMIIYDKVGHLPMEEIPSQSVGDVLYFLK
ncbi:MAG: alpha/beta hydrolase [Bernardetiaceae bacterium]|nr:alpha/beta hydrolase [Bernardetiaceae bacterium]